MTLCCLTEKINIIQEKSSWETREYTGATTQAKATNQKVLMGAVASGQQYGVYICDIVTVQGKVTLDSADDEFVRSATNSTCGYVPSTVAATTPTRGTTAVVNVNNKKEYFLSTTCYRIITDMSGITYPKNYWRPCSPEQAKLFYEYRDIR